VIIVADRDVPYSQLVAALDEVRLANYHRIALAASPRHADSEEPPEVASGRQSRP
jgi:biopolymer transport protein ExbD